MCFDFGKPKEQKAAAAPPPPEAVPESVKPVGDDIVQARKRNKGVSAYNTAVAFENFGNTAQGLNIPTRNA